MNKQNLKTLALSPSKQNLFLALSIGEGLGMVDEVLEWWWEERIILSRLQNRRMWIWCIESDFVKFYINSARIKIRSTKYNEFKQIRISIRQPSHNLPPLPTIIQNIKDYTFALILHLWEFGEEEVE